MNTSTLLMKNNRIRICNKNQLSNLVNHILRNYKPETRQYKKDFNATQTPNNVFISPDGNKSLMGKNWFCEVEQISMDFKVALQKSLDDADKIEVNVSLSRSEKDKTIKSINYLAKLKNYDPDLERSILPIIETCEEYKNQESKNKDYSIFDKKQLNEALDFYHTLPKEKKVKSLNAKKKNLTQILENVEAMKVANQRKPTASSHAIGFEETLIKIPKHNEHSLKATQMMGIYEAWHDEHYKDFKILGGAYHKDERTKKGNLVDDHLHIIKSGFNQSTKKFDLPDYTFKKGLEMARKQGIEFDYDGQNYNKAGDILRLISGEALQTEFYKFANKKLLEFGCNFQFEKKTLDDDEMALRAKIKEQADLPKSKRDYNLATFLKEESLKSAKKLLNDESELKIIEENKKIAEKAYKDKKERIDELELKEKELGFGISSKKIDIQSLDKEITSKHKLLEEEQKQDYSDVLEYDNKLMEFLIKMADGEDLRDVYVFNNKTNFAQMLKTDDVWNTPSRGELKKFIRKNTHNSTWDDEEYEKLVTKEKSSFGQLKEWLNNRFTEIFSKFFGEKEFENEKNKKNDLIEKIWKISRVKEDIEDVKIKAKYKNKYRY